MKSKPGDVQVIGADANNLRQMDAAIPARALTAVVGVSGSGKSSLVEQTLAVEAAARMRCYLDIDLPAFTATQRAYVGPLPPILFAGQRAFRGSSRTTLATATGILRVLRRLFARFGQPFADDVKAPVPPASPETFAAWLKAYARGGATIWAVPVLQQATTGSAAVDRLKASGIEEVTLRSETDRGVAADRGRQVSVARFKPLRSDVRHTIEARVGRIDITKTSRQELEQLLDRAWAAAPGSVSVELHDVDNDDLRLTYFHGLSSRMHQVHPKSTRPYAPADPHRLSFNAPDQEQSGACPSCRGLGVSAEVDEAALAADPERSMHEGAFALWTPKNYRYVNIQHATIEGLKGRDGFDPNVPWRKLGPSARALVLDGSAQPVEDRDPRTGKKASSPHKFAGFRSAILEKAGRPTPAGAKLSEYVFQGPCRACDGTRWSYQARALRVGTWSIDKLLAMPLSNLEREARDGVLWRKCPPRAKHLVANLQRIVSSLVNVGLGHLSGDRGMLDISDGESRRVRVGAVIGSRVAGLLLVLDEPARGLHEQDLAGLGDALRAAAKNHTVVMSEHRQRLVSRADCVIEVGPGAGQAGGQIQRAGKVAGTPWARSARLAASGPKLGRDTKWLELTGVTVHNVVAATVKLPLGKLVCIAGVSGSGKSSFVRGALVPALAAKLPRERLEVDDFRTRVGTWKKLSGERSIKSLHALDQSPAAAQRRSLVATFAGIAEQVRQVFASQPDAKKLGLAAKDFGTNAGRGRCQKCLGLGAKDGGDCPVCGGLRFGADALSVRIDGWHLSDLFTLPIGALGKRDLPSVLQFPVMDSIIELGIGHLSLGRSLDTLSGGEVQRLRIARALSRPASGGALFVLDEPAGGLHPADVNQLERALRHMLADGNNTVVLVEHDPHLLAVCDYIVEFGPGGGPEGGRVIASATPADLVKKGKTPTARALSGAKFRADKGGPARVAAKAAPTREAALRVRAELRQIAGEDVEVPDDDDGTLYPAATVSIDKRYRAHEIANLDIELGSFLLDMRADAAGTGLEEVRTAWAANPDLHLQLHPFLEALALWGPGVPQSAIDEASRHGSAMGLGPKLAKGATSLSARVTGARFEPTEASPEAREAALRDAWALGGGYVELADGRGRVHQTAQDRPMDLRRGLVGPRHPVPAHCSRLDPRGACATCKGAGAVPTLDLRLVVRRQTGKVLDSSSLRPEAAAILKGVLRSEMVPFFQRLSAEGLWDPSAKWNSMDKAAQATMMHGFWTRPGHGTFRKAGKLDGSEVNHWLRWDGLVSAVGSQVARSKDAAWREQVHASQKAARCLTCEGTGLGPSARLQTLGGRSLFEWVRDGSLKDLLSALQKVRPVPPRAARTRERIALCLKPLRAENPRLREAVTLQAARAVWSQAAVQFTGMPLAPAAE